MRLFLTAGRNTVGSGGRSRRTIHTGKAGILSQSPLLPPAPAPLPHRHRPHRPLLDRPPPHELLHPLGIARPPRISLRRRSPHTSHAPNRDRLLLARSPLDQRADPAPAPHRNHPLGLHPLPRAPGHLLRPLRPRQHRPLPLPIQPPLRPPA